MKAIIDRVTSAGLVDRATARLLEHWKMLDAGTSDRIPEEITREVLEKLVIDIAELINPGTVVMPEMALDVHGLRYDQKVVITAPSGGFSLKTSCAKDSMGRLVFEIPQEANGDMKRNTFEHLVAVGSSIKDKEGQLFVIKGLEKSYTDERVSHLLCTVLRVETTTRIH